MFFPRLAGALPLQTAPATSARDWLSVKCPAPAFMSTEGFTVAPATPAGVRTAHPIYPGEARADFAESVLNSSETGCLKHNGKCLNQSAGLLPGPLKKDLCSDRLQDANAD